MQTHKRVHHGYAEFSGVWGENAQLAWDTLEYRPTRGIPFRTMTIVERGLLERLAGCERGAYCENPERVCLEMQRHSGACCNDQWIPADPLQIGEHEGAREAGRDSVMARGPVVIDGIVIDGPEAVAEHVERFDVPRRIRDGHRPTDEDVAVRRLIAQEVETQRLFGCNVLKLPHRGFQQFPRLDFATYGCCNYSRALALFPDVIERTFALQADAAVVHNRIAARAIVEGGLPKVLRLDCDAPAPDCILANLAVLDRIWFPHFARAVQPFVDAGVRLLWHCDGGLSGVAPRLIEAGVGGFHGFTVEHSTDYEATCRMTDRNGDLLMIWAGVSVVRTLRLGKQSDVVHELRWLVENGPPVGLFLGASGPIAAGVNWDNVKTLVEGLSHYREHGRFG
ncbi:MAG: hypothetical protein GX620_01615 [Chloroflexi bacterium]|nr:hypothetical protein [Chloroflexota bacterium]